MTKICLVRHGETNWNVRGIIQGQTNIPLNNIGEKQANQCGIYLSQYEYDIIISSSLKRAKKSAELINQHLNLPIVFNDKLKERHFGIAEGQSKLELIKKYPDQIYPKQESRLSLNRRVMSELNQIIHNYHNKNIIVVAHGAVINSILSSVSNHTMGSKITTLKNGSFTIIKVSGNNWSIESLNLTNHLDIKDNITT